MIALVEYTQFGRIAVKGFSGEAELKDFTIRLDNHQLEYTVTRL